MSPPNALGVDYRHFDELGGVFTLSDGKQALMGRANTAQLAVVSVRNSGDPFHLTTGEKIIFGASLLVGVLSCFIILVCWACGANGYGKKLLAQLFSLGCFLGWSYFCSGVSCQDIWRWLPERIKLTPLF